MQSEITTYTATAKSIHWLMALLLLGQLVLGFYMQDLPFSPQKLQVYSWHKWAGVTVFLMVWLRLAWRVTNRPPNLPDSMSVPMRLAAHAGHGLLYGLMIAVPLSGWLMSSAKGFQTVWFGVLPIPDLVSKDRRLGSALLIVHQWLNYAFIGVLIAHVAAALKHALINRDDIFRRMLPERRR
jgi:cytochrome b561